MQGINVGFFPAVFVVGLLPNGVNNSDDVASNAGVADEVEFIWKEAVWHDPGTIPVFS